MYICKTISNIFSGKMFHAYSKMSQPSIGGSYYFYLVLFWRTITQNIAVYLLKEKTEVLYYWNQFYAYIQIYNIKRLRTDCDKNNLSKNRTIVESVKSMLHTKKLPLYL